MLIYVVAQGVGTSATTTLGKLLSLSHGALLAAVGLLYILAGLTNTGSSVVAARCSRLPSVAGPQARGADAPAARCRGAGGAGPRVHGGGAHLLAGARVGLPKPNANPRHFDTIEVRRNSVRTILSVGWLRHYIGCMRHLWTLHRVRKTLFFPLQAHYIGCVRHFFSLPNRSEA